MGLLSSVLPGVREFRTPFVAGCLWVTAAIFWEAGLNQGTDAEEPLAIGTVRVIANEFPSTVQIAVLAFAAYLLGLLMKGVSELFERKWWHQRVRPFPGGSLLRSIARSAERPQSPGAGARALLANAAREHFSAYPDLVQTAASEVLQDEYGLAELSLAQKAPEQYQQYDRVRSEAEFRNGVWLPSALIVLSMALFTSGPAVWLIATAAALVAFLFKAQGIDTRQRAQEQLATAIYHSLATTPLYDGLARELAARAESAARENKRLTNEIQLAWLLDFLVARALDERASSVLARIGDRVAIGKVLAEARDVAFDRMKVQPSLRNYLLVALGGAEWAESGKSIDGDIRADVAIEIYDRVNDWLSWEISEGSLDRKEVAVEGVRKFIPREDLLELMGEGTKDEFEVAERMMNVKMDRYNPYT